jgi:hypothetical protein
MKRQSVQLLSFLVLISLLLASCAQQTVLRFSNETQCGDATITFVNSTNSEKSSLTVPQGQEAEIELAPLVSYRYTVEYPRQPGYLQCDTKHVTVQLKQGQTLNVSLTSELDETLQQAPATAEAAPTPTP